MGDKRKLKIVYTDPDGDKWMPLSEYEKLEARIGELEEKTHWAYIGRSQEAIIADGIEEMLEQIEMADPIDRVLIKRYLVKLRGEK